MRTRMPRAWLNGAPEQRFLYLSTMLVPIAFVGFAITASFVSFAWSDQYYILPAIVVGLQKAIERMVLPSPAPAETTRAARRPRRAHR